MSDVVVLEPRALGTGRGSKALLVVATLAAVVFVAGFAAKYFSLNQQVFGMYWPRRGWLLLHVGFGIVAILTGPGQLWLGLTGRTLRVHRQLGLVYMGAIVLSSAAALYLAFHTEIGWVFGAGLAALAVAWLLTTGLAYAAIRRGLYEQHKEWMIRSYVVTFAFVNFRMIVGVLQAVGFSAPIQEQLAAAAWLCWAVPLLITEAILQGRKIFAVSAL